ncbi:hypothetical protein [Longimicrobium terrae]|uniref:Uncharacterized protein n=1 Tax=Longimicrobium terrae TaxID=1639882 RepID=A0A841H1C7_9BACT|nr:hypothetical protein [Longimicrobium terrae]MBB4637483.1 hypothetical protein [Longimicrobium terrae]MBB6071881.1 hypothetical protein [Longimicrobium terrae]NNC30429.1 hypothetical protein [Longimicrobium terrae]
MRELADKARPPGRVVPELRRTKNLLVLPVPIRDEKVFTDEEFVAAMAFILPPDRAREEGLAFNAMPDLHGFETATGAELAAAPANGPRVYDGDLLDLLSLVSDSCAERAWQLMKVSPDEGAERRETIRRRVEELQAYLRDHPDE